MALALLAAIAEPGAFDRATARLAPERPCLANPADPGSGDVTVCGRRRADRFRVPLVVHDPGDPRHEGAWDERVRLIRRRTPIEDMTPFLVGGGMAGASVTTTASGTRAATLRPLAP